MSDSVEFQLAHRPGFCTAGSPIDVLSNTFIVRSFPTEPIYHYDATLPPVDKFRRANEIIHRLQTHTAPNIFSAVVAAFDGAKNLYVLRRPLFPDGAMTFTVNMSNRPPVGPSPRGVFNVTLKKVSDILPSDLTRVLQGHSAGSPITTTPLQALNVLIQQAASLRFPVHTKQKFYDSVGMQALRGLEIWRGFFASIRPTFDRLLVNVDMATGVMYQRGLVADFILAYFGLQDIRALNQLDESHRSWSQIKNLLKGLEILQRPSNRLRKVKTIIPKAGDYEFMLTDGQSTTVVDYFRTQHGYNLIYPQTPGIVTRRDEVIPFELCLIKEGQLFKKKTSPEVTAQMLTFSKKRPSERLNIIQHGMEQMQLGDSPFVQQAGLSISPQPMQIHGRKLPPPPMVYGKNVTEQPSNGSWNMLGKQLFEPMSVKTWGVISFEQIPEEAIQKFVLALAHAMVAVGMRVASPKPPIMMASPYNVEAELEKFCTEAKKATGAPPTMLLVILPSSAAPLRKSVKQFGDIRHGVVTQCVRADKLLKANNQYHNNLILKINAKLGGCNTIPSSNFPAFSGFVDGKTMVVGADVTHPGPGILRPSVAALVASIDRGAAQYISRCDVQGPRTEIIENLQSLMSYALKMFYKYRSYMSKQTKSTAVPLLPERIVFYRDGVSEGEIQRVVEEEIQHIMNAVEATYSELGAPFRAKLTFIVVGKRHHIRFFPKQGADKSGNAPAGLMVDQDITAPRIFDFYLQSHAGLLGTSRPSHYIVVKDDNNFDANTLAGFSFSLCHTYARATRSVSIPAPCYYADIACARADYHFDADLNYEDDLSSNDGEFDLTPWVKGFRNVHTEQSTKMYFV